MKLQEHTVKLLAQKSLVSDGGYQFNKSVQERHPEDQHPRDVFALRKAYDSTFLGHIIC